MTGLSSIDAGAPRSASVSDALASEKELWLIADRTAEPNEFSEGREINKSRVHEFMIDGIKRSLRFEYGKPVPLPPVVAIKLLAHDNFLRVDENGDEVPWKNPPKQPEDLQAGERFALAENETVAAYDELTIDSLRIRAFKLVGGEKVRAANKETVIAFIKESLRQKRLLNTAQEPGDSADFFDPEPEPDDSGFFQQ